MTEVKIRLQQTDQVKKLVDFLTPCPYEVNLVSGRYTIDAKSLLGIYSLDLSNPLTLVIYSDDCDGLLRQLRSKVLLRNQKNILVIFHRRFQRLRRDGTLHVKMHQHIGENGQSAQSQNRHLR